MSIDNLVPSVTPSPVLVTDATRIQGGSTDGIQPALSKNVDGETVSAAFEVRSTDGAILAPRLTNAIVSNPDLFTPLDGMFFYNSDNGTFDFRADGGYIPLGAATGDVLGPEASVDGNIAIFDGITGKIIADSGVHISQVPAPGPLGVPAPLVDVNQVGNIGVLQFVDGVGTVFVDSLVGAQYIENDFGPESQICTLITGDLPGSSTTPSALLELQSTTGAILISRMTTSEIDDLNPSNGMLVYDTDVHKFKMFEGGAWLVIDNTPPEGDEVFPPTYNNQLVNVIAASQGGFGGGSVGTNITMSDNTCAVFDTTNVDANSVGFAGAVTDGRYIYFVPFLNNVGDGRSGQITRYDTKADGGFMDVSSYEVFDMKTVNANSKGYFGGCFDGRYVYFSPQLNTLASGFATRYDTHGEFTDVSSYQTFDLTGVNANSKGFSGAIYDENRYVYYIPGQLSAAPILTRYDTWADYEVSGSYEVVDLTALTGALKIYVGASFDGTYIYLIPNADGMSNSGLLVRYNTNADFNIANFTSLDLTTVNAGCHSFYGSVFDGKWLYLIPLNGRLTRYDTTAAFVAGSCASIDLTATNADAKSFFGGCFDGRYVYLSSDSINAGSSNGQVTRYDVTKAFTSGASYSFYDTKTFNANSRGWIGAICDGRYVYFVPISDNGSTYTGQITRLKAYSGPPVAVLTHGA